MKVGDLVTLSAYGKSVKRASWIGDDNFGLIIKVVPWGRVGDCDYIVRWQKPTLNRRWHHERYNQRKDLKYLK